MSEGAAIPSDRGAAERRPVLLANQSASCSARNVAFWLSKSFVKLMFHCNRITLIKMSRLT